MILGIFTYFPLHTSLTAYHCWLVKVPHICRATGEDYSAWVSCKKWRVKTGEASLACLYFPFPSHAALKLQGTQAWFPFCPAVASTPLNFIVGRSLIKLHIHQCHYLGCWFYSLIPSFATLLTSKKKYVFRYSLEASMKSDFQGEPNLNNVPIMEVISRSSIHLVVNKQ